MQFMILCTKNPSGEPTKIAYEGFEQIGGCVHPVSEHERPAA